MFRYIKKRLMKSYIHDITRNDDLLKNHLEDLLCTYYIREVSSPGYIYVNRKKILTKFIKISIKVCERVFPTFSSTLENIVMESRNLIEFNGRQYNDIKLICPQCKELIGLPRYKNRNSMYWRLKSNHSVTPEYEHVFECVICGHKQVISELKNSTLDPFVLYDENKYF